MKAYHGTAGLQFDDPITGNSASGALITIRVNSTQALADIYDLDEVAIANPLTANALGNYAFKTTDNIYDIIISEGAAIEQKLVKVEVFDIPASLDLINDLSQAYEFATWQLMVDSLIVFPAGKVLKTTVHNLTSNKGGTSYVVATGNSPDGVGSPDLSGGGYAKINNDLLINVSSYGVITGVDSITQIQAAQNDSDLLKLPLDFSDIFQVHFSGRILFDSYLEWRGAGKFDTVFIPLSLTRTDAGGNDWVSKRDTTVAVTHFLIQDLGFNGQWNSGPFVLENLLSMFRVEANGSTDRDITALRCHFINPPHEGLVCSVATTAVGVSSGGIINGVRMLYCSGDVGDLNTVSLGSNMFKTIHGSIDQPGLYGEYPISDVISFGNTCRGWRSLCDFKRGTKNFSHNASFVDDMTDVQSISVDGVKDGTIGPANTGRLINRATGKNFYELQGININVMGGTCDLGSKSGVIGAMVVTDYAYPAENGDGVGNRGNQSINVNTYGFTCLNVPFHGVRLINTKDCFTSGVVAENCLFEAISSEYQAGKVDINSAPIVTSGNRVNNIRSINCRSTVSNSALNPVVYGENITNENDQYDVFDASLATYTFTQLNINKNDLLTDYAGGVAPLFWGGAAAYVALGAAEDAPSSFSLEDVSAVALQFKTYDANVPVELNGIVYFQLLTKKGTAPSQSILVQQFNSSDVFLSSTFIPLLAGIEWERRLKKFIVDEATCSYIKISLLPAGQSASDSANVGTTLFADIYFGTRPR